MILTTIFKVTKLLASFLLNIYCNIVGIHVSKWNLMTLTPFSRGHNRTFEVFAAMLQRKKLLVKLTNT